MDGSSGSAGTTSTTANEQPGTVGSCDRPWLGSYPEPASNAIARRSTLSVVSVVAGSITSDAVDLEDMAILGRAALRIRSGVGRTCMTDNCSFRVSLISLQTLLRRSRTVAK